MSAVLDRLLRDSLSIGLATGVYAVSFGGGQVFFTAARYPQHMHAAVLVDTGFGGPPPEVLAERQKRQELLANNPTADRPGRVYPTLEAALARFRLMPPQPAENHYVLDFIARRSLRRAPMPDGSGEGWTWKFDPNMWEKLDRTDGNFGGAMPDLKVPAVHLYGDKSRIIGRLAAGEPSFLDRRIPNIEIPDSHHHVMIDQPLALVAALRTLLASWPG